MFRELQNSLGQATGDAAQAARHHRHALYLARKAGMPLAEARALAGIGRALVTTPPRRPTGASHLSQALAIYRAIGSTDAARLTAEFGDDIAGEASVPNTSSMSDD